MKVKIIKASREGYWYSNQVGTIHEVKNIPEFFLGSWTFPLKNGCAPLWILVSDCIEYTEPPKPREIWEVIRDGKRHSYFENKQCAIKTADDMPNTRIVHFREVL